MTGEYIWDSITWYGRTSAEMRELAVKYYLEPAARLIFASHPKAQSVILAIAQYWNDEANDATHVEIIVTSDPDPKWPACMNKRVGGEDRWKRSKLNDAIATIAGSGWGDDNYQNIVAFASYCMPDCHQEMSTEEAYSPYAVCIRGATPEAVTTKIVGKLRQRAFENEFNVGFNKIDYKGGSYDAVLPLKKMPLEILNDRYVRGCFSFELTAVLNELRSQIANSEEPLGVAQIAQLRALLARGAELGPLEPLDTDGDTE